MTVRVALNGFGRIGRCVVRAAWGADDIEFVHINDLTAPGTLAHLLQWDSVHGPWKKDVQAVDGGITIDGARIATSAEKDPTRLPWKELGVDVVLECTGVFTKRAQAALHLDAGAGRVVISAPATDPDYTVVMGVNDDGLQAGHRIVSNASCTTNCLAPVAKVLHQTFGIENGLMTTVHSYTMDQRLLDAPHSDLRRARAAAMNMVPTSTGAAKAVGLVLPELKGRLNGLAVRVPTPNASLVDLVFNSRADLSVDAINAALRAAAAEGPLKGILGVSDGALVSADIIGDPRSSIADLPLTQVMGARTAKVLSWYDNEWGFSNRMVDLVRRLGAMEVQ
jgi:glyceraldehyde 3-phosphate dehydrogenase